MTTTRRSNSDHHHHHSLPWIVASFLTVTIAIGTYLSYSIYHEGDSRNPPIHELTRIPSELGSLSHKITDQELKTNSLPFFAKKTNFFNQKFVKLGWAWTTGVIWLHLFNLASYLQQSERIPRRKPQQETKDEKDTKNRTETVQQPTNVTHDLVASPRPVPKIIVLYLISTSLWISLTQWFFGTCLIDRFLVWTGAKCVASIDLLSKSRSGANAVSPPTTFDNSYCERRWGQRLPGLDQFTISTHRPYWSGGIDISGHIFLLSFSILLIISSLKPSLNQLNRIHLLPTMYRNSILVNLGLILLWWWMLLMTSLYFHGPSEKISGVFLGTLSWWFTEWLTDKILI